MYKKNKLIENKKERIDIIIALVIVLFAGIFIFSKVDKNSTVSEIKENLSTKEIVLENVDDTRSVKNENQSTITEQKNFDKENRVEEVDRTKHNYIKNPTQTVITSPSEVKNELNPRSKEPDEEILNNNLNNETLINEQGIVEKEGVDKKIKSNTQTIQQIDKENTTVEIKKEITEVKDHIKQTEKQPAAVSVASLNKAVSDCTIIIGVFKVTENKNKIIKKLADLGYNHNQGLMKNNSTYVGVPVKCDNEMEIKKMIQELNKAFNVNTWLRKNS